MDRFFHKESAQDFDTFWYDTVPVLNQSAFLPYTNQPTSSIVPQSSSNSVNMNNRLVGFLRRNWQPTIERQEPENDRCHRHVLRERTRREREKQGYLALHSMLPHGAKNDKNSIIQTATKSIQGLKGYKELLERSNHELEVRLAAMGSVKNVGSTKISVRIDNPASGLDPMLEVLKCLKSMTSRTTSIQSTFSNREFVAAMDVETEMEAHEIEQAVKTTLEDVERKLLGHFPEVGEAGQHWHSTTHLAASPSLTSCKNYLTPG